MSKPKTLLKQSKGKKSKAPVLSTSDDFLALGVEYEEAAGKWRAGDVVKSLRFFGRAVEIYDEGLQKFPGSLDLAYNKARVQLEIVTHPLLLRRLEVPVLSGLEAALKSHRYALNLDPDNPDTLFNTAQVLTTIAEEAAKGENDTTENALKLLEEALELQSKCLSIQEMKFEESEQQRNAMMEQPDPQPEVPSTTQTYESAFNASAKEDQWFSVVEPVTLDTLIDTALSQLCTLTTLCSILSSVTSPPLSPSLSWIEEYSSALLISKLSSFAQTAPPPRLQEIAITKANFLSAFLEATFHQNAIDANTYKSQRDAAFQTPELLLSLYPEGLTANAQSLISFSSALADDPHPPDTYHGNTRWHALSAAITDLSSASKLPSIDAESTVKTHVLRGEASFLLWRLGHPPTDLQNAVSNAGQLLKNAEVFYRNASRLSEDQEEKAVAKLRSEMAGVMNGKGEEGSQAGHRVLEMMNEKGKEWVRGQIEEMVDEGLVEESVWNLFM